MTDLDRVRAPYNFVPLSETVVFPSWGDLASQDVPFADGVCGSFEVEIEAATDLFVGGAKNIGTHKFFATDAAGQHIIPGTSLKGMLRSALEIASFGKMSHVDDRIYGLRDLHNRWVYGRYMADIVKTGGGGGRGGRPTQKEPVPLVSAGWMVRRPGAGTDEPTWVVQPCNFAKIEYDKIRGVAAQLGAKEYDPGLRRSAVEKYKEWDAARKRKHALLSTVLTCRVEKKLGSGPLQTGSTSIHRLGDYGAVKPGGAPHDGVFVFTGQPSVYDPAIHGNRKFKPKHHDFFFHPTFDRDPTRAPFGELTVSPRVREAFLSVHSDSGQQDRNELRPNPEWEYWQEHFAGGGPVPVFLLLSPGSSSQIRAIGLAMMFRLAYDLSTRDIVKGAQELARSDRPDLAETMFGFVDDEHREEGGRPSLRGRVSIGDAKELVWTRKQRSEVRAVLSSPKPTFYPAYVEQGDKRSAPGTRPRQQDRMYTWKTYMKEGAPRPRGWKRYVAQTEANPKPHIPAKIKHPEKVVTRFQPLGPGSRFRATVRVHNLRPVELGALRWILDFGGTPGAQHGLGMAKSLGYGGVHLRVLPETVRLRTNDPSRGSTLDLDGAQQQFESWIEHELTAAGCEAGWKRSREIFELIQMATPSGDVARDRDELRYMRLDQPIQGRPTDEFSEAKKAGLVLRPRGGEAGWAKYVETTTAAAPDDSASRATGRLYSPTQRTPLTPDPSTETPGRSGRTAQTGGRPKVDAPAGPAAAWPSEAVVRFRDPNQVETAGKNARARLKKNRSPRPGSFELVVIEPAGLPSDTTLFLNTEATAGAIETLGFIRGGDTSIVARSKLRVALPSAPDGPETVIKALIGIEP